MWLGGEIIAEHSVKPEIRYLDTMAGFQREEDRKDPVKMMRLLRKGWKQVAFQGRPAIQRLTCIDCLNANERARGVWAELKAAAETLERNASPEENFYHLLCEVDE